jgi:hypothetical protein
MNRNLSLDHPEDVEKIVRRREVVDRNFPSPTNGSALQSRIPLQRS